MVLLYYYIHHGLCQIAMFISKCVTLRCSLKFMSHCDINLMVMSYLCCIMTFTVVCVPLFINDSLTLQHHQWSCHITTSISLCCIATFTNDLMLHYNIHRGLCHTVTYSKVMLRLPCGYFWFEHLKFSLINNWCPLV